jgi:hypothetical protein
MLVPGRGRHAYTAAHRASADAGNAFANAELDPGDRDGYCSGCCHRDGVGANPNPDPYSGSGVDVRIQQSAHRWLALPVRVL